MSFEEHVWRLAPVLDAMREVELKREKRRIGEFLAASPESGKERFHNVSTPVLATVQALVKEGERRKSMRQAVTPPPQRPYYFPELLAPIDPP